ncbi:MAG: DUF167 domain-containing protein [Polyangiaceae bacterium]|jgi:uncharacterized protein YggU (UPF0235/DUF167 family)
MGRPKVEQGAVRVVVRAKPRAKTSVLTRAEGLAVDVSLAAAPIDGAANEELVRVLGKALSVPKRAIRFVSGETSRNKVVAVTGLAEAEVVRRLARAAS